MGLSGRRVKQRIPADPRNLAWADDAAKFGSNYLSKFGWDASKGLGVDGDGRTSHIKVTHKLDMLGIGAAHQKDPDGIAWKQNKDFENLLKRLNENISTETVPLDIAVQVVEKVEDEEDVSPGDVSVTEKKRKRKKDRQDTSGETAKKRRKKDTGNQADSDETLKGADKAKIPLENAGAVEPVAPSKPYVPRNRAHRARAIASKAIASKSSTHIAEILGIASTPASNETSGAATPFGGKLTPIEDGATTLEKLTTSTKSVADYFREKLLAKSSKSGTQTPVSCPDSGIDKEEESYDTLKGGIGASRMGIGGKADGIRQETERIGLSNFSSLMSSAFLSATSALSSEPSIEDPSDSRSDVGGEKLMDSTRDDREDDSAWETRRKEKKERRQRNGEGVADGVELKEKHRSGQKSKEKEKEERRKDKAAGIATEAELLKKERRRLRKEKKSRKESSPGL